MQRNEIDELFMKQQELEKKEEQLKLLLHSNAMNIKRGRHDSNDGKGSPTNSQRGHARKRTTSKLNVQSEDKEKKNTKKTKRSHSSNQHILGIANESSDAKTERSSVELVQGTSQSE